MFFSDSKGSFFFLSSTAAVDIIFGSLFFASFLFLIIFIVLNARLSSAISVVEKQSTDGSGVSQDIMREFLDQPQEVQIEGSLIVDGAIEGNSLLVDRSIQGRADLAVDKEVHVTGGVLKCRYLEFEGGGGQRMRMACGYDDEGRHEGTISFPENFFSAPPCVFAQVYANDTNKDVIFLKLTVSDTTANSFKYNKYYASPWNTAESERFAWMAVGA